MTEFRLVLPAVFFAVWTCGVAAVHFRLAGPERFRCLEEGRKMALLRQHYELQRGRILDKNGTVLAWSERYYDLVWNESLAPDALLLKKISGSLGESLSPEAGLDGKTWVLKQDLTPEMLLKVSSLLELHPSLGVRNRTERIVADVPLIRERVGSTVLRNGVLKGVSGWEDEFDAVLRGTPGEFEVLLDRRRRWIDSSWKLIQKAMPGKDVRVPLSLEEMTQ